MARRVAKSSIDVKRAGRDCRISAPTARKRLPERERNGVRSGALDSGRPLVDSGEAHAIARGCRRSGWTRARGRAVPLRSTTESAAARPWPAIDRIERVRAIHRPADSQVLHDPVAYARTDRIHLVSSFLASLLAGRDAPIDPGDGSGMNLMDVERARVVSPLQATAPGSPPSCRHSASASSVVGPYPSWQIKPRLSRRRKVVAWTGDNPWSLVGTGLVGEGRVAISLGTSDTVFGRDG